MYWLQRIVLALSDGFTEDDIYDARHYATCATGEAGFKPSNGDYTNSEAEQNLPATVYKSSLDFYNAVKFQHPRRALRVYVRIQRLKERFKDWSPPA